MYRWLKLHNLLRKEGFLPRTPDANPRKSCNAILVRDGDNVWEELDTEDELKLAATELVSTDTYHCRPTPTIVDRHLPLSIDTYHCRSTPYGTLFSEMIPYKDDDRHTPGFDRYWVRTAPYEVQIPMQPESIYTPHVLYPRKGRSKQEIHDAKCKAIMEKIITSFPKDV
ncbi:hypothetical protein AXX17_AT1G38990 [Arabidopsis thaliana]|uniref:Uncharacterized protein n=1 Tax=Arabidopsis thaliana TaxID=3702 RepID=A0A178WMA7_ARATH|nr:hypothetical protein AXX17_AT1G38990 [Arabidopsis thaliana]